MRRACQLYRIVIRGSLARSGRRYRLRSAPGYAILRLRCKPNRRRSAMNVNVSVSSNMVTTTFDLPGYRVVKTFGLVRGVTVRSRSIFGTIGASLETLVGGNITLFEEMCEKTREEALEVMMQHATEHGANAVIGMRYDATEVMQGVTEVLAYGTAVEVERITA